MTFYVKGEPLVQTVIPLVRQARQDYGMLAES